MPLLRGDFFHHRPGADARADQQPPAAGLPRAGPGPDGYRISGRRCLVGGADGRPGVSMIVVKGYQS